MIASEEWEKVAKEYRAQYRSGARRTFVFRDVILKEIESREGPVTLLDIGCGAGFDDSPEVQKLLINAAAEYIGVEPDANAAIQSGITLHRGPLEEAAVPDNCVDIAFAVMVLEHVENPSEFFQSVYRMLKPNGVFYGFTPNKWHYVSICSHVMETLRLKDIYLSLLYRSRKHNYENFPTHYRCNSRSAVARAAKSFDDVRITTLGNRIGQSDYYFPSALRPIAHLLDLITIKAGLPGGLLICRAAKS